jgi:glycosyltransferase involved in cell wall biosynthesis
VASEEGARGIGPGGGLLVAADTQVAASRIVRLLKGPAALNEASASARARVVDQFSWSANARRIEQLWEQAAGRVIR